LLALAGGNVAVDISGVLLAVGAGGSYALFALIAKELLAQHPPEAVTAVLFSWGALLLLPFLFFIDINWLIQPAGLAAALSLGLLATTLAYLLYMRGLAQTPAATAVTLSLAEPLTAALLGIFLLHEPVTAVSIMGMVLIFGGLLVLDNR
jgi:DME family drug/metabolite transporter